MFGKKEYIFKILVVGEVGTGKTSIIKKYVHNFFTQHYKSTIGVDFALKVLDWDSETIIKLQLWDIAGQERFGNMTRVYYKQAVGAFVVFDMTRLSSLESSKKWKKDIDDKIYVNDTHIPVILLANKVDMFFKDDDHVNLTGDIEIDDWGKTDEDVNIFCKETGFIDWFKTSAKTGVGIDIAMHRLVEEILKTKCEKENIVLTETNTVNLFSKEKTGGCICNS